METKPVGQEHCDSQVPLGKHRHSKENSHLHCPCLAMAEQYPLGSKELSAREPQTQFWGLKSVLMLCDFDKLLTASYLSGADHHRQDDSAVLCCGIRHWHKDRL